MSVLCGEALDKQGRVQGLVSSRRGDSASPSTIHPSPSPSPFILHLPRPLDQSMEQPPSPSIWEMVCGSQPHHTTPQWCTGRAAPTPSPSPSSPPTPPTAPRPTCQRPTRPQTRPLYIRSSLAAGDLDRIRGGASESGAPMRSVPHSICGLTPQRLLRRTLVCVPTLPCTQRPNLGCIQRLVGPAILLCLDPTFRGFSL